jgi:hypothetical protein
VTEARERLLGFALVALPNEPGFAKAEQLADDLVRAVEARCAEHLRSEGHHWSGQIGHGLRLGAELIDPNTPKEN